MEALDGRRKVSEALVEGASIIVKVMHTPVSSSLLAPSVAGTALLAAMLAATPEPIEGAQSGARLIRLANGAEWPQLGAQPLFVRHFYQDCVEGAMSGLLPRSRFVIHGNNGSECCTVRHTGAFARITCSTWLHAPLTPPPHPVFHCEPALFFARKRDRFSRALLVFPRHFCACSSPFRCSWQVRVWAVHALARGGDPEAHSRLRE
jgi:hypothetical protein